MTWFPSDTWIVLTGACVGVACAIPGCFLVLRKMSMMGDAISHAVLPGLALAFLITESRDSLPMFLGAAIIGVLTAVFTEWIKRVGKVDQGAAMGVVFTSLFAVGLVLIVQAADKVDLDPGCVLYGAIELVPLHGAAPFDHPLWLMGTRVPQAFLVNGVMALINIGIVALLFKELRLAAFDSALADSLGFSSRILHYLLMAMVALTTVAAFESVGSIIVIAMLIVPAASALLLTHRLGPMLVIASVFGALAALLGHLGALTLPQLIGFRSTSTSGMMALATGAIFALVWLSWVLRSRWHQRGSKREDLPLVADAQRGQS